MPEKESKKDDPSNQNVTQHVDEVNGACYGKQDLYKVYGRDEYRGGCEFECRLKAECCNASREMRDGTNEELTTAKLDANGSVISTAGVFSAQSGGDHDFICNALQVPPELRTKFIECFERLAGVYLNTPQIFENLIRRVYLNQKQSDLARMRGVTRQMISKATLKNYAGIMKDLMPDLPRVLTGVDERTVYMLLWVDRCSIRAAAKLSGYSIGKIYRVKQKIASKIKKTGTVKNERKKKSENFFEGGAKRYAGNEIRRG